MSPMVEVAAEPVTFCGAAKGATPCEGTQMLVVFGDDLETGQIFAMSLDDASRLVERVVRALLDPDPQP